MLKVLIGGTLIDGRDGVPLPDAALIIEGERIAYAGLAAGIEVPGEAEIIDLKGKAVIPGLIDAHIHLDLHGFADTYQENLVEEKARAIRAAREMGDTLQSGITTVRNCGSVNHIDFAVKEAINSGWVEGPRILTSGKIISMTAEGNDYFLGMYREADGCNEVRKAAREQLKAGADFLKLMATGAYMNPGGIPGASQLSLNEMAVVVEEAAKLGKKVAAHAHGRQGIIDAIKAGSATIEHGTFLDEEVIELMLEREVYLVPTYALGYLMLEAGAEKGVPEFMLKKTRETEALSKDNLRQAIEAGVKVAFGTDAGTNYNYHGRNAFELVLLVEHGLMNPMQALLSATAVSASALGIEDEVGTLEKGKLADLVVIDGNLEYSLRPLLDDVEMVFKSGRQVK